MKSGRGAPFGHRGRYLGGALFWADVGFAGSACRVSVVFWGEVMRHAAEKHQSRQRLASGLRFELGSTSQVRQPGREV